MNNLLITWFGCGRFPKAPGTMGSIGALPLCWWLADQTDPWFRVLFALGFTALAIIGAAQDQLETATKDPSYVVADEVAGMLWSTAFIPAHWIPMLLAFLLFRVFDILKPPPARFFDRSSKTSASWFRRGAHIVLDDVIAGIYSAVILHFILILFLYEHLRKVL